MFETNNPALALLAGWQEINDTIPEGLYELDCLISKLRHDESTQPYTTDTNLALTLTDRRSFTLRRHGSYWTAAINGVFARRLSPALAICIAYLAEYTRNPF